MQFYPLKMKPILKQYLWGTESWEVSTHPDGLSMIANGEFAMQTLKAVLGQHLGIEELPILIKIIDAHEALSLQVHPNDEYARRIEGQPNGKNEMWYVMEAEPGAELVLGFRHTYNKDELRALIESGEIMSAVNRVPVKAGDCYTIPAGLLHAIGAGIKIAEVQQSSNLTYRVFDYGRTDSAGNPRELHIDKALGIIDTAAEPGVTQATQENRPPVLSLTDWEYFKSELLVIYETTPVIASKAKQSTFECLVVVDLQNSDEVTLTCENDSEITLQKGETVFIPSGMGNYTLNANGGQALILSTTV